jgi:histone acetyltransferase (RNA polymerase elongator complex component)
MEKNPHFWRENHTKPFIIPLFIPNMGCPHRCVFCDQTAITGHQNGGLSPQQVRDTIRQSLGFKGRRRGLVEVAFYGGNFLGLPIAARESLLDEAQRSIENGQVESIRFSTRPDTISLDALNALAPYTVRAIEVGAQSMDDTVLALSRRGHTAAQTRDAVKRLKAHGLQVGLQIMPGLPGDTPTSILETGRRVAELQPDFVRIYPTVVVKNTVLAKWYASGRFTPLSLADAVDLTKQLYLLLTGCGIQVIRMGLQPSGSLLEGGHVVAGPFHPAFGHLVHSAIFLDQAAQALEHQQGLSKKVTLKVYPKDLSRLMGLKKGNIKHLVKRFHLEELRVIPDPGVRRHAVRVENLPNT